MSCYSFLSPPLSSYEYKVDKNSFIFKKVRYRGYLNVKEKKINISRNLSWNMSNCLNLLFNWSFDCSKLDIFWFSVSFKLSNPITLKFSLNMVALWISQIDGQEEFCVAWSGASQRELPERLNLLLNFFWKKNLLFKDQFDLKYQLMTFQVTLYWISTKQNQ